MATHDLEPRRSPIGTEAAHEFEAAPDSGSHTGYQPFVHPVVSGSPNKSKRKGTASQRGFGPDSGAGRARGAILRAYMDAGGWELDVSDDALAKQAVSHDDVERLRSGESDGVSGANGKNYRPDPDHPGKVIGHDPNKLPITAVWSAARTTPIDYFAIHFQTAKTEPERVFQDLINIPRNRVLLAQDVLNRAEFQLAMQPYDPAKKANLKTAQTDIANAQQAQAALARQFYIMRNDVFHADIEEHRAAARLRAQGFDPTRFHIDAQFMCTPEQIRKLETDFIARFPAQVAQTNTDPSPAQS